MPRLLDRVNHPADLRALSLLELEQLAREVREELVATVHKTGGHLASNLGVVELTLILHRLFDSPRDKIVWDVSHQVYVHKLVTGRKDRFETIRQHGGLSGFADRKESSHDQFGAGHAGTAVSAALGMAAARDITGDDYHVIAVLGDGAMTAGMALEAFNHAGHLEKDIIVILNDNAMSISPNVGALSKSVNKLRVDPLYRKAKDEAKGIATHLPLGQRLWEAAARVKSGFRDILVPASFYEQFGFEYYGPIDGHDLGELEETLLQIKEFRGKPVLLHVLTEKGHGIPEAAADPIKSHSGVYWIKTEPATPQPAPLPTYSKVFADAVSEAIERDPRVVAITAAMLEGTGLVATAKKHPTKVFDVGIAEQHAVTFAAGLATQGVKPIAAIYSTFLQRGFDQIVHDVTLQNLHVTFAMDRAGFVGDDGKTHQGAFDISYLRCLPNIVVAAGKDEQEMRDLLWTGLQHTGPFAFRFPRGNVTGMPLVAMKTLPIGKGELVRPGRDVTLIGFGATVRPCEEAAEILLRHGIEAAVINLRYVKPLDKELLLDVIGETGWAVTVEENVRPGGVGDAVLELLADHRMANQLLDSLTMPDEFVDHGPQKVFRAQYGLDGPGIAHRVRELLQGVGAIHATEDVTNVIGGGAAG